MSNIERQSLQRAPVLVERRCRCGDWGGFGFSKGDRQEWWCWPHYPYKTGARHEAAEIAEALIIAA